MRAYPYELVGGHPVLDFLNTVGDWTAADPEDRLNEFSDVTGFAVAAGVLTAAEAARVRARPQTADALRHLRDLRAVLARVMKAIIRSRTPAQADLDALARVAARAAAVATLRGSRRGVSRTIDVEDALHEVVRWRLADAAVALLGSPAMAQLKSCPSCGWFFLDTSKNRSRRWCSMQMCGSAVKSRRYYYRQR